MQHQILVKEEDVKGLRKKKLLGTFTSDGCLLVLPNCPQWKFASLLRRVLNLSFQPLWPKSHVHWMQLRFSSMLQNFEAVTRICFTQTLKEYKDSLMCYDLLRQKFYEYVRFLLSNDGNVADFVIALWLMSSMQAQWTGVYRPQSSNISVWTDWEGTVSDLSSR